MHHAQNPNAVTLQVHYLKEITENGLNLLKDGERYEHLANKFPFVTFHVPPVIASLLVETGQN